MKQLPLHGRAWEQRLLKRIQEKKCYECKAFAADLHTAFNIHTLTDNAQVHPERFCHCCHHSVISAKAEGVGSTYKLKCKVYALYITTSYTNNTAGV